MLKFLRDRLQGRAPSGSRRSPLWSGVRAAFLREHPECAVCGGTKDLEVHHILPFYSFPESECDPANLITLCESKSHGIDCHRFAGHLGDYKKLNPSIMRDVVYIRSMLQKGHTNEPRQEASESA